MYVKKDDKNPCHDPVNCCELWPCSRPDPKKVAASLIQEATALVEPIVKKIESGPQFTKDHYAQYMAVLAEAKDIESRKRLAAILIFAGANRNGVLTALSLT